MTIGVLNAQQVIREIIRRNPSVLKCDREILESPAASSIDAPLGDYYYVMRGSCRPGAQRLGMGYPGHCYLGRMGDDT